MTEIPAGTSAESMHLVTPQLVTNHLGVEAARVLATPILIGLLEQTARDAVKPLLGTEHDTVGTDIHLRHLAATPLGMHIRLTAEVTGYANQRICFRLEAHDEAGKIADGVHERAVISISRFATKAAARLAAQRRR